MADPGAAGRDRAAVQRCELAHERQSRFDQDARSCGIGYLYALSKRTGLYAAYAHISNRNGAGYTVGNNSEAGSGNTGYDLGIRHTF